MKTILLGNAAEDMKTGASSLRRAAAASRAAFASMDCRGILLPTQMGGLSSQWQSESAHLRLLQEITSCSE